MKSKLLGQKALSKGGRRTSGRESGLRSLRSLSKLFFHRIPKGGHQQHTLRVRGPKGLSTAFKGYAGLSLRVCLSYNNIVTPGSCEFPTLRGAKTDPR